MRAAILHCTLGAILSAAGVACTPTPRATTIPEPAVSESDSVRPSSVGTPDPLRLVDADPNGRWVAMCQARHDTNGDGKTSVSFGHHGERYGDAWRPYLAFGSAELAVDDILASSPSGRVVAFVHDGRLKLYDAAHRSVTVVDPHFAAPGAELRARTVSLDTRGQTLAFVSSGAVWLHDVEAHTTRRVSTDPGTVRQVILSPSGSSVVTLTSKGRLRDPCDPIVDRVAAAALVRVGQGGWVVDLATGARRRLPRRASVRWTGEALLLDPPRQVPVVLDAQRQRVSPFEPCDAPWVVSAKRDRPSVVVQCDVPVEWTPDDVRLVPDFVAAPGTAWIGAPTRSFTMRDRLLPPRFGPYRHWDLAAVDDAHAVVAEPPDEDPDVVSEAIWIDLDDGTRRSLGRFFNARHARLRDHHVAIDQSIIDMSTGQTVLALEDETLAYLGNDGRALVGPIERRVGSSRVGPGPLRWVHAYEHGGGPAPRPLVRFRAHGANGPRSPSISRSVDLVSLRF